MEIAGEKKERAYHFAEQESFLAGLGRLLVVILDMDVYDDNAVEGLLSAQPKMLLHDLENALFEAKNDVEFVSGLLEPLRSFLLRSSTARQLLLESGRTAALGPAGGSYLDFPIPV